MAALQIHPEGGEVLILLLRHRLLEKQRLIILKDQLGRTRTLLKDFRLFIAWHIKNLKNTTPLSEELNFVMFVTPW